MSKSISSTPITPKNVLVGYGKYFLFNIKHHIVRYLVWIAVIVFLIAYIGVYYKSTFNTQAKLNEFTAIGASAGMVALVGKISCMATLGGAVWTKIWMFSALTLGIGMVFQVTKGARADEENGRTELFCSKPFGIHSTLAAVVSGALILCAVIGLLTAFVSIGLKLDPPGTGVTGSVIFGLSVTAIGWLGVGVGALTNQLSASASLANSTGSIIIPVFYGMRMIGDMGSNDTFIWLSPVGWGELMAPWAQNRGWLIIPVILLTAALIAVALVIESRRDYGSGVLKDKKGKSAATPLMHHSWGLILHLYKGSIIGWSIGIVIAGLMFGSVANSMLDLLADAEFPMLEGSGMDALMGLLLCFIGLISVVLPMQTFTGFLFHILFFSSTFPTWFSNLPKTPDQSASPPSLILLLRKSEKTLLHIDSILRSFRVPGTEIMTQITGCNPAHSRNLAHIGCRISFLLISVFLLFCIFIIKEIRSLSNSTFSGNLHEGNCYPDLIFGETIELQNIIRHPMASRKCQKNRK